MRTWIGQSLGGCLLEEELEHSSRGVVYRGIQLALGREVVVKILPRSNSSDASAVARFLRQARILAQLNHPNIIKIYDAGDAGDVLYVVLEYVQGLTIKSLLELDGRFPPYLAAVYAAEVADALEAAYQECGLIHRALRPEHLMVDWRGQIKVIGFSLARARDLLPITTVHSLVSSFSYASPEDMWGKPLDHRSDIYTLGIVLYEMVTGTHPFVGRTLQELTQAVARGQVLSPGTLVPEISPELAYIIFTALATNPAERFAHAGLMAEALRALPRPSQLPTQSPNAGVFAEHTPSESTARPLPEPLPEQPPYTPLIRGRLTLPMHGAQQVLGPETSVPGGEDIRGEVEKRPEPPFGVERITPR